MKEGIIKFNCNWVEKPLSDYPFIEELNIFRNELRKFGFIGVCEDGTGYGNISMRIPDTNQFIISGSQTGCIINADISHYCLVTDFDIDNNSITCEGPVKASSESLTHAVLYKNSPFINCVIHVHNREMWENLLFNEITTSMEAVYGSVQLANEIKGLLKEMDLSKNKLFVLGGHEEGILAFGGDLADAQNALLEKLF